MSNSTANIVHATMQLQHNETYSEDSSDDSELVTLTNTAVFLHENSNRIESELQSLEEQVRKLQELDGILETVRRELRQLAITSNYSDGWNIERTHKQHVLTLEPSTAGSYSSDCAVSNESHSGTMVAHN